MTDAASKATPDANSADLMREQRLQRNLKILVGGLGALILFGVGAVVIRMVSLGSSPRGPGSVAQTAVATPNGETALELPNGAKVVSVSVSGNRLAVHPGAVSHTRFDRVREGMAEIENRAQPLFTLVGCDHPGLELAAAPHRVDQGAAMASSHERVFARTGGQDHVMQDALQRDPDGAACAGDFQSGRVGNPLGIGFAQRKCIG